MDRLWGLKREDLCICITCYHNHRVSSKEEALNNQIERMTWPADVDQPLSSAFPGLAKWVCKCRAMVAEKEAIRGPTIMGFYLLMSHLPAALTGTSLKDTNNPLSTRICLSCIFSILERTQIHFDLTTYIPGVSLTSYPQGLKQSIICGRTKFKPPKWDSQTALHQIKESILWQIPWHDGQILWVLLATGLREWYKC